MNGTPVGCCLPPFDRLFPVDSVGHGRSDECSGDLKLQTRSTDRQRIMVSDELRKEAHNLDVTVWVGKHGIESVADELADQLQNRRLVKVKFLRAARGSDDTETLATELADAVDADLIETRGNTAVLN